MEPCLRQDFLLSFQVDPEYHFSTDTLDESEFFKHKIFHCFQEVVIPMVEGTVRFTKKIPNFPRLPMTERISLLKQNCFCVPLVLVSFLISSLVADWLRTLFFRALNCSSSHYCGFEPNSGHMWDKQSSACGWSGVFSQGSSILAPPYGWLGSEWVK